VLLVFGCLISRGLRNSDANKSKSKADKYFPKNCGMSEQGIKKNKCTKKIKFNVYKVKYKGCNKGL